MLKTDDQTILASVATCEDRAKIALDSADHNARVSPFVTLDPAGVADTLYWILTGEARQHSKADDERRAEDLRAIVRSTGFFRTSCWRIDPSRSGI